MTEQLEPTRETDIRVAEAMGWRWYLSRILPTCRVLLAPDQQRDDRVPWDGDPTVLEGVRIAQRPRPHYTTDPALVVPMLARIGELVGGPIDLSPPDPESDQRTWSVLIWRKHLHREAATANLVLCAALLAVWDAREKVTVC